MPKTKLTLCQCEQPWYIWRYIFISFGWKLHPNGSGEIGAHFSAHYELPQLSSSSYFDFMLWRFGIFCFGMVLRVSNVNIHALIGFWRIDFVRAFKTFEKKFVVCFRAKDILISVAAASTDSDQRIIQDPSNHLNETYWHWSIDHNLYFNEIFDGKRLNFVVLIPEVSSNARDGRDANCCPWHSLKV
jgi:hypothetical protein